MAKALKTTEPDPSLPQVTSEVTETEAPTPIKTFVEDAPALADPEDAFGPVVTAEPTNIPPQIEQTESFLSSATLAEMQRGRESIARR